MVDYNNCWCYTIDNSIRWIICVNENQKKRGEKLNMLPLLAVIMFIFGSLVLYGGLVYFLYRAWKSRKN